MFIGFMHFILFFFFNDTATTEIYTLSLHDALPICGARTTGSQRADPIRSHRRRTFDGYKSILTNTPSDGPKLNAGLPSLGCEQLFTISACVELPFPRPGPGRSEKSLAVRPRIHPGGS